MVGNYNEKKEGIVSIFLGIFGMDFGVFPQRILVRRRT